MYFLPAVVNIHQSTSHPKGIIVVPENQRTSSLKVSFNETVRVSNVSVDYCCIME